MLSLNRQKLFYVIITLTLFLISSSTNNCQAQKKAALLGKVLDSISHEPIEFSTINILSKSDSALLSYTLTDKFGFFSLINLPSQLPLRLLITHVGYKPFEREITLLPGQKEDLKSISMLTDNKILNDIIILADRPPVIVRQDTVEFNAAFFKTRPDAVVEELLKKLPGVQVNIDGSIYVNGKRVEKILLDGKPYYGTNLKMASQTLNAKLIDKVIIFDNRETDPNHLMDENSIKKIIDLKLKNEYRRSVIGKLDAGVGTRDRYQIGALANFFQDTLQFSAIALSNNLNHNAFSSNDLYNLGGFSRGGDNAMRNVALGGNAFNSIETVSSTGFNINDDPEKNLAINLTYFYSRTKDIYNSQTVQQQFFTDSTLLTNSKSDRNNIKQQHAVSGLITWKAHNNKTQVRYTPSVEVDLSSSFSKDNGVVFDDEHREINQSTITNFNPIRASIFNHEVFFYHQLKKRGSSITISHALQIAPNHARFVNFSDVQTFAALSLRDTLDRSINTDNRISFYNFDAVLRLPLFKRIIADIDARFQAENNAQSLLVYDKELINGAYSLLAAKESFDLLRVGQRLSIQPQITFVNNRKQQFIAKVIIQRQLYKDFYYQVPQANHYYFYALPSIEFRTKLYSFSYGMQVNYPTINQLQPITVVYSQLYDFTGNAYLKPYFSHTLSFRSTQYLPDRLISLSFYAKASLAEKMIMTYNKVDTVGATHATPVNGNGLGDINLNSGFAFSKRVRYDKDIYLDVSSSLNLNYDRSQFWFNEKGISNTFSYKLRQTISFNYKDILEDDPVFSFGQTFTHFNDNLTRNETLNNLNISNKVNWSVFPRVSVEGYYSYLHNLNFSSVFRSNVNLVNTAVSWQLQKSGNKKLKLSINDLLNQNVSVLSIAYDNKLVTTANQILKRYFALSFSMNFEKKNHL